MNERFIKNVSELIVEILDKPFSKTTAMFQIIVNILVEKGIITEEEARETFTNENIEDMVKALKEDNK